MFRIQSHSNRCYGYIQTKACTRVVFRRDSHRSWNTSFLSVINRWKLEHSSNKSRKYETHKINLVSSWFRIEITKHSPILMCYLVARYEKWGLGVGSYCYMPKEFYNFKSKIEILTMQHEGLQGSILWSLMWRRSCSGIRRENSAGTKFLPAESTGFYTLVISTNYWVFNFVL